MLHSHKLETHLMKDIEKWHNFSLQMGIDLIPHRHLIKKKKDT